MPEGVPNWYEDDETDQDDFSPEQFVDDLGLSRELLDHPIADHEGNMTDLRTALRDCDPVRDALVAQVGVFDDLSVDRNTGMLSYLKKSADAAQQRHAQAYQTKKKI